MLGWISFEATRDVRTMNVPIRGINKYRLKLIVSLSAPGNYVLLGRMTREKGGKVRGEVYFQVQSLVIRYATNDVNIE